MATELSLFGIPVITALEGYYKITPNFEGIIKCENRDSYFNEISKKLNLDYSDLKISTLISSIKWYCLLNYGHEIYINKTKKKTLDLDKILENKTTVLKNKFYFKEMNNNLNTELIQRKSLKECLSNLENAFSNKNNQTKLIKRLKELQIQINI